MVPNIFMVVQKDYITIGTEVYRISEMYPKYLPQSVPDARLPPNVVFAQVHTSDVSGSQKSGSGWVRVLIFFSGLGRVRALRKYLHQSVPDMRGHLPM